MFITNKIIQKYTGLDYTFKRVKYSANCIVENVFSQNEDIWAKVNEQGVIIIIVKDTTGKIIYEEKTRNYYWFREHFYVYKFFLNSFDM